MSSRFKIDILPAEQVKLFHFLSGQSWLEKFYLAGGTSLALQIGHRESIDFDFFTLDHFNTSEIKEILSDLGNYEPLTEANNTLYAILNDVRISFFRYKYPLVQPPHRENYMSMASILDVGLMKLEAIAGRGAKKDFIDLFFILKKFPMNELLENYEKKYGVSAHNHYHLMKSLSYFEDAEKERMPVMYEKVTWEQVKKMISTEIKKIKW